MTHVVQQLLALARAEPGSGPALAVEAVGLSDLVAQAVADHAVLAEAKGIDLGAANATGNPVVMGDPTSLRTLLDNLVDNAIRYSPEGTRVDVDAGVVAGRACLAVTDHGPGIPLAERERVFDRFYRHEGRSTAGSGLGLAIVKAIAERHEATVTLDDTPGGGLTVRVAFPAPTREPNWDVPP
jgi:two-component system OmpR family sensor kinase